MDPFTAISLGLSGAQAVGGLLQMANAKEPERPTYDIPESARRSLALKRRAANTPNMPGEALMQEQMDTASATTINTAKRSGNAANILDVLEAQQQAQSQGVIQMALQKARYKQGQQQRYQAGLDQFAQYEDKAFDWNEGKPYIQEYQQYQADKQSGFNNLMTGLQSGVSTGMAASQANQMNERYQSLYGDRYKTGPQSEQQQLFNPSIDGSGMYGSYEFGGGLGVNFNG